MPHRLCSCLFAAPAPVAAALLSAALLVAPAPRAHAAIALTPLDLADIVGGGDGTGTGAVQAINITDGSVTTAHVGSIATPTNVVQAAVSNPFVDGVFVAGGPGPVPVSTTGVTVTGLSAGSGSTWDHVWANDDPASVSTTLVFDSFLGVHAGKGITFDLDAIEAANPGLQAVGVDLLAAIGSDAGGGVDFFVVVDGAIRDSTTIAAAADTTAAMSAAILPGERFLSLIAVDQGSFLHDWSYFGNPVLTLDVVPEPASLALLGLGGLAIVGGRSGGGSPPRGGKTPGSHASVIR